MESFSSSTISISLRLILTSLGASIPILTLSLLMLQTVIVISLPICIASFHFLLNTNIKVPPCPIEHARIHPLKASGVVYPHF